ncbi:MAG TPA: hypothetical protein DCP63_11605 [Bacteroidetes bacterium]|nr:hypothetical protein [Bacteroidota bacterium]
MSEQNSTSRPADAVLNGTSLFWLLALIARTRRILFISCAIVAVLSLAISLLLPKWYESTVSFVPPKETGALGSLGSLTSTLRDIAPLRSLGGLAGARGTTYNFLSILDSRSTKDAVIRKFNLMEVYDISDSSMEKTVKELESNVTIDVAEEGHISVSVLDTDPQRAAAMANYYVEVLNTISDGLNIQSTSKYRTYLEQSVREVKDSLKVYEEAYTSFQKHHGMMAVPEDVQGSAKAVAQLYSEKTLKEIEVQFLTQMMGVTNPELERRKMELRILDQKLSLVPDLALEHFRLYRAILIQSKILEVLIPLYEQSRFEEKKELPSVAVLDRAVPAERKAKPKRLLIVLISTFSAGLLTLVLVALRERIIDLRTESPDRYQVLRSVFRLKSER